MALADESYRRVCTLTPGSPEHRYEFWRALGRYQEALVRFDAQTKAAARGNPTLQQDPRRVAARHHGERAEIVLGLLALLDLPTPNPVTEAEDNPFAEVEGNPFARVEVDGKRVSRPLTPEEVLLDEAWADECAERKAEDAEDALGVRDGEYA